MAGDGNILSFPRHADRTGGAVVSVPAEEEGKPAEKRTERYIQITMRANNMGHDINGPKLTETGWYTLGMTCTADGAVHYFLKQGVEDLTEQDRIGSSFPYGFRASQFETYFFDVLALDNGRTWSTHWVIDDPKIFVIPPQGQTVAQLYRVKKQPQRRQQVTQNRTRQQRASNSQNTAKANTGRGTTSNSRSASASRSAAQR